MQKIKNLRRNFNSLKMKKVLVLLAFIGVSAIATAQNDNTVVWKKNFGGNGEDYYRSVATVSDGIVAVGYSYAPSFGNGDWAGVMGKGMSDAIIVKYDNSGNVVWKKNFGGSGNDRYYSVTTVSDGLIAVGYSIGYSFGNGDWDGVTRKSDNQYMYDAIIVKYDNSGNVVWKKNFGGNSEDIFNSVITVSDGIIAIGESYTNSFGYGDWVGVTGKGGGVDAIIVKYDNSGNVVWKKNFGGSYNDRYHSVTAVSDGIIAAGYSNSIGTGDWTGIAGKGGWDAIIVKYDNSGNVVWKKNFGGSSNDLYNSVTTVSDGIIAVGSSVSGSFGNGDWAGITGKGGEDAIIVKYDNSGNVVWKKNFGGSGNDTYKSVATVSDGIIAVGSSVSGSFGNGDWAGIIGKGNDNAIIVKYDNYGNIVGKMNFGGSAYYNSVTTVSNGIIAAGYSSGFGCNDWIGVTGKGNIDAIIVKYYEIITHEDCIIAASEICATNNLIWQLSCDSTLTIRGSGMMVNWTFSSSVPWYNYRNSIKTIIIDDGIASIGDNAFYDCSNLTSVTIPNSVTSIGYRAFYSCSSLTSVIIGNSVTSIGNNAFWSCSSLSSVIIGPSVTSIGEWAFYNCSDLTSVVIPNSVTTIGNYAFRNCSGITSVIIGASVTNIGDDAFSYCSSITSVTIPENVTTIGNWAFNNCSSLKTVNYHAINCTIGPNIFYWGTDITTLSIGNSVQTIPNNAFAGCFSLTSITSYPTAPPTIFANTFSSVPKSISVHVLCTALTAYQSAPFWSGFTNYQTMDGSVPIQPSVINGNPIPCSGEIGLTYSVTNVPGVIYNWILPLGGWTITSGQSTNSITVTAGIAGGNITVTPSNGCGNGTARTFLVNVNPNITPTFNIAQTEYCAGATIPALPTTSNNGITGAWSPPINNTATTTYTFTPTSGQCVTTTPVTIEIAINANVTPAFNIAQTEYCAGATIPALTTTSNNGITGTWSPPINNTATTTYTFTPTSGQCVTTPPVTIEITINPNVTPAFNIAQTEYCAGATIPALPTTSNNGITGTWTPPINNTTTTTYTFTPTSGQCVTITPVTIEITINPNVTPAFNIAQTEYCAGATIPALPTTSNNGITGTWSPPINNTATTTYTFTPNAGQCANSAQITIIVVQVPVVTITANKTEICAGEAVIVIATLEALPNMTYQWYANSIAIAGENTPILQDYPTVTTDYTFTATQFGTECVSHSNTVTVTVIAEPVITITELFETICQGSQVTFTANYMSNVTYYWFVNGVIVPGAMLNSFTYTFNHPGVYYVEVSATNIIGCCSPIVYAGTITVKTLPSVAIVGPTIICEFEIAMLYAVVDPIDVDYSYHWFLNGEDTVGHDVFLDISDLEASPHPYIFTVLVTDMESGCIIISMPHAVYVESTAIIAIIADKTEVCAGEPVQLTAYISPEPNMIYQWYANGDPIEGGTAPNLHHYPTVTTDYTFTATQLGTECVSHSNIVTVMVTIGIEETAQGAGLLIYPNPTTNELFIKSDLKIEKVEVYSILGTLLLSENNFKEKISVSTLPAGIYFLRVYTDKGMVVSKVLKE